MKPRSTLICALALLLTGVAAFGAPQKPLSLTHVPAAVRNLTPLGPANAADRLRLAISLPMRDPVAWNAFLRDLYDRGSPDYRRFLTPAQVTERFGPTVADYEAVVDFAKGRGLTVVGTHADRLMVDVEGSVAVVEKVFHTTINRYRRLGENGEFYAPSVEPSLDLATPILRITGLDNYYVPHPLAHKSAAKSASPRFGSGPAGSYLGGDFRAAYVPNVIPRGEGQAVALVEFDGYFPGDIRAYETQAGMASVPLRNILIDGFNGIPYSSGETEVTLDIDMAVAMAPGLSEVAIYEGTNGFASVTLDLLDRIASDNSARQISCSWGLDDNPAISVIYQTYAAQGQSFFQAAGDSGAFVPFNAALDSDNPFVTIVGGTTLSTSGPGGSYISEAVWNWYSSGEGTNAGGGGFSTNFALPVWQDGVANANNLASTQFRNCPDVALTADNIYIVADHGQAEPGTGGTSAAAPLWASFMALVNEQGSQNGHPAIGFANPTLYSLANPPFYDLLFHDITLGNNTNAAGGPVDYPATQGYDLATGLGTPTAALINALAPTEGPVLRPIKTVLSGGNGNGQIDPNECNDLTVTITNAGSVLATGVEGVLVSDTFPAISIGQSAVAFPDVPPNSSVTAGVPFTVSSSPDFVCGSAVQLALTLKADQGVATSPIILTSTGPCQTGTGTCPGADLSIALSVAPNPVLAGSNFVCALVASNAGPSAASDIVVQLAFPPGMGFVVATNVSQGFVTSTTSGAEWSIAALPAGGMASGDVVALDSVPDTTPVVTATIDSATSDPNQGNNTASVSVGVNLPGADLGVSMIATPNPAPLNGRITYDILVTNNGPFAAQDAVLTMAIPNVSYISAAASQGKVLSGGAQIDFGLIPPNAGAEVVLLVRPTTTGDIIAIANISLPITEMDPVSANNIATVTTTVNTSADLAVMASESPNPSIAGSNLVYVATFTNRGPAAATDVVLTHLFPTGSQFISTTAIGANVGTNANSVVWNIGALSNGEGGTITTVLAAPTNVSPGAPPVVSTFTISGQPGDPNTNDNIVILTTINSNAFSKVVAAGATLLEGETVTPGATVLVALALRNAGNIPTTALTGALFSGGGVTSPNPSSPALYGALAPGATATNVFSFTAVGTNGGTVTAQLKLQDGATDLGVANFTFTLPSFAAFWNTNFISIPDQRFIPNPDSGPASPYPSIIVVSNVTGLVSQISVTISNMSHSFPHDVSMLLESPDGLGSALMSSAAFDSEMSNVTFTITPDAAAAILPANGAIVPGSYQPGNYGVVPNFPAPAPDGPFAPLGIFSGAGSNFNGAWSLYVIDTTSGDAGSIADGWGLSVETIVPVNQLADLGISLVAPSGQIILGDTNTFSITVTNAGPDAAPATVVNQLPSGLSLVSAAMGQGGFSVNGQTVTYNCGLVPPGTSLTITNSVRASEVGPQTDLFTVAPGGPTILDPSAINNAATTVFAVIEPTADVAAFAAAPPTPFVVGVQSTFTLTISNAGPQVARNATGVFSLGGAAFLSATTSQGTYTVGSGNVLCSFGDIGAGQIETVQIAATPVSSGLATNIWSVASDSSDPSLVNNRSVLAPIALSPTPILIAGPMFLLTTGSNNFIAADEQVTVSLAISNGGYAATTNLIATLLATNGVSPVTASQTYGALVPGSSAAQSFTFTATGLPGATVLVNLSLADGVVSFPPLSYAFVLPNSISFSNSAPIFIPDIGAATPYPASITVFTNGVVSKVAVELRGFTHSFPRDVNVLLAGPAGQTTLLEAHAGGPFSVTNLDLSFDDGSSNSLPETALFSGAFLGTAYSPIDTLPGFSTPTYNTSLAVFDGASPNGQWSLYVYDDSQGDDGVINQGWALNFSLVSPLAVPQAGGSAEWRAAIIGGTIQLTLTASPGQTYIVDISTDLVSWTPVSTNGTGSGGAFTFTDSSTNSARRFYRASLVSP
jgi:uncharacterized repeat protein (TIGR01451 family)